MHRASGRKQAHGIWENDRSMTAASSVAGCLI